MSLEHIQVYIVIWYEKAVKKELTLFFYLGGTQTSSTNEKEIIIKFSYSPGIAIVILKDITTWF